jgi:hypothetical protein
MAINGTRLNGIPRETIENSLADTERTAAADLAGSGIPLIGKSLSGLFF